MQNGTGKGQNGEEVKDANLIDYKNDLTVIISYNDGCFGKRCSYWIVDFDVFFIQHRVESSLLPINQEI